jgi:hypothetical protein
VDSYRTRLLPPINRPSFVEPSCKALLKDDAVDKIEYNEQDEYAVHNKVYPDVGFVFIIHVAQLFEHNWKGIEITLPGFATTKVTI